MIELTLRYPNSRVDVKRFRTAHDLADYLITRSVVVRFGLLGFEVAEDAECLKHEWKHVPPNERTLMTWNFACRYCDQGVAVDSDALDAIFRAQATS